jgi:hypothetical protein
MFSRLLLSSLPLLVAAAVFASPAGAPAQESFIAEEPPAEFQEAMPATPQPGAEPHLHEPAAIQKALLLELTSGDTLEKDKEITYILTLRDSGGRPVTEEMLEEQHEAKVHVFAIDAGLEDFHHIHPEPGKDAGAFVASFTPATARGYHIFADVKLAGHAPQLVPAFVEGAEPCGSCCAPQALSTEAAADTYKAELSFAGPLKAGTEVHGEIAIRDAEGKPVDKLEPVMGAYAHILAFPANCQGALHLHAHGAVPAGNDDRGSTPVAFMLTPEKPGFLKIFAHVRIGGQDRFFPFGVEAGG